jgi:uncharacterized membrane protein YbhN (UPF0104 family)
MIRRLQWPFSLAVLALVLILLEPERILAEVQALHPAWLALALIVTALQTLLSAWRWRFTALRLGLDLPWRQAVGDYFLAGFANQILPGGVLGDAWRAQRHAGWQRHQQPGAKHGDEGGDKRDDATAAAWRAVLIERGSGQLLVVILSLVSLAALVRWQAPEVSPVAVPSLAGLTGSLALVASLGALVCLTQRHWWHHWLRFRADVRRALLVREALVPQLAVSLLIVFTYTAVFALAGRAIGIDLPTAVLLALALPVLLAMLIPLSIAGWGWREAVAGGLWLSLGWPPEQGVAVSMAYGVIVFLGSTPGALVWLVRPDRPQRARKRVSPAPADRHRRAVHRPGDSCASPVDGSQRDDRSGAG